MRPDIANDPVPNSGRDEQHKEWFDQYNFISRDPSTHGCQDGGEEPTWMETFHREIIPFMYGNQPPPPGLRLQRSTITVSHTYGPHIGPSKSGASLDMRPNI